LGSAGSDDAHDRTDDTFSRAQRVLASFVGPAPCSTVYEVVTTNNARAPRRSPRATSREAIVEVGVRIVDEEGLDALNVRRIGAELGIAPMTVYTYVSTKDELLDAISARALVEFASREVCDGPWEEQVAALTRDLYSGIRDHPGVADLISRRPPPVQALDRYRERMLRVLYVGGFSRGAAVDALTALVCHAFGHAQAARGRAGVEPAVEAHRLRRLPAEEFPLLTRSAHIYSTHLSDDAFETGLQALLSGLKATLLDAGAAAG
jgi:AcrR family transcriptional regulator